MGVVIVSNLKDPSIVEVIDNRLFYHYFQPIFSIEDKKIFGYECLIRSDFVQNLGHLFETATKKKRLNQLDVSSIELAVEMIENRLNDFPKTCKFFLNIYPSTLICEEHFDTVYNLFKQMNICPDRIILEINESEPIKSLANFFKLLQPIRDLGIQIALDDVGKGMAPLKRFLEIKPDIIKLDRYFAQGLAESPFKQGIVQTMMNYCLAKDLTVILEGVENLEDLQMAHKLGIQYAQGFLLSRPCSLDAVLLINKKP